MTRPTDLIARASTLLGFDDGEADAYYDRGILADELRDGADQQLVLAREATADDRPAHIAGHRQTAAAMRKIAAALDDEPPEEAPDA